MHWLSSSILFICCFCCLPQLSSQALYAEGEFPNGEELAMETSAASASALFSDPENKRYYVDFEDLKVHLKDVVVRDENGEVLHADEVIDLPVNTIYELDFSGYRPGTYYIELRSFADVSRHTVQLQ